MGRRQFCGALRRSYDDLSLEYWDGFRFGDSAARAVLEIFANVSYPVVSSGAADADQRGDAVEVRRHRMGWGCVVRWRVRRSLLCRCLGCADKSPPHGCQILSALQGLLILLFPRAAFLRRFAADTQH